MFPETERSTSLPPLIASGYFGTALAREPSDQVRSGSVQRHIRTSHGRALVSSLHHPKSFGSGRRFPFEQSSNRLSPEQRLNPRRSVHHSQLRRLWIAAPKKLPDRDGFGVRSNLPWRSSRALDDFGHQRDNSTRRATHRFPRRPSSEQAHHTARQGMKCLRTQRIHLANLQGRSVWTGRHLRIARKGGSTVVLYCARREE